jgi:hypothetical protein
MEFEILLADRPNLAIWDRHLVPIWESADRADAAQLLAPMPISLHTSSSSKPKQPIEELRETE